MYSQICQSCLPLKFILCIYVVYNKFAIDTGLPEVNVTLLNQSVEVTLTAKFIATVKGVGPFTYQWQKGKRRNITNETYSTFVIREVSVKDQAYYRCYVTNNYGDSVLSDKVFLEVTGMLALNVQCSAQFDEQNCDRLVF